MCLFPKLPQACIPTQFHFSISVLVKALFTVNERLDDIWLGIQKHTPTLPTGTPRQKTYKEKQQE